MIIGVDESGTGAIAGPFTVAAVALDNSMSKYLGQAGVRDSKKLKDRVRRRLLLEIADVAVAVCVRVDVDEINQYGQGPAWARAVIEAIQRITKEGTSAQTIIDGIPSSKVAVALARTRPTLQLRFMPKADDKIVAVGAASIVAKTFRNDMMLDLSKQYPQYRWDENFGYGTADHRLRIKKHGGTPVHRKIKVKT